LPVEAKVIVAKTSSIIGEIFPAIIVSRTIWIGKVGSFNSAFSVSFGRIERKVEVLNSAIDVAFFKAQKGLIIFSFMS
jgi:hypothetical protein